ncbi:hypothetical protein G647_00161 [Cladophialophora carrionii CBS 160.54]|uniref:Uncharacterized protein n=1 Tax=Cladophialophora carrionii CBS 160.54 TaxID=1279043 RepID=V9DP22_9EURO|nr:uncharacterized protein G647_00161 [Cladophialophora carrionii CBS 160.54]ETI27712.1 hypothetical protein G647_00161 [Cladophialophora carrionii CBS 160.54]
MPISSVKVVTAFVLLATSALAAAARNSSQTVIPNASDDPAIDPVKVNRYKSLLGTFNADEKFNEPFRWTDILDEYHPLNADCSARCLTCAPGCHPSCCVRGSSPATDSDSDSDSDNPAVSDRGIQFPRTPGPRFPGRPVMPPLSCPCHCEADCPRYIQTICCFTPGSRSDRAPVSASTPNSASTDPHETEPLEAIANDAAAAAAAAPNPLMDRIRPFHPRDRVWGRPPGRPLACPCFCEPTCPRYIQTICCTTPGSGIGGTRRQHHHHQQQQQQQQQQQHDELVTAPKIHDTLAMITESAHGESVSVLAAVNLTVFDSFITFNLVQGLGRTDEIVHDPERKTFEITLAAIVGSEGKETALAQTFVVIDGSRLLEEEQVLLGSAFVSRAGGVTVDPEFLTPLQEGLPVLTGVETTEE